MQGIYNFLQVEPDLGTSGAVEAESFAGLRADGYQIVINLLPNDSKYATAGEAEIVAALGMDYIHIPVDFAAPIASNYDDFAAAMKAAKGKKIYVHCAANWRVSCFVAVYGERELGWTRNTAEALIEKAWGEPDDVWKQFITDTRAQQS